MKMITVGRMPQTVHYSGKTYGPSEKPLAVPEELAAALGLTPVDGALNPAATAEVDHEELEASRTLATQAKEKLDQLLSLLAPLAQEGEMPDEVLARVVGERRLAQSQVSVLQTERNTLAAQLAEAQAELLKAKDVQAIPPDALKRITDVKGVGDKLAPEVLKALTAPPKAEG